MSLVRAQSSVLLNSTNKIKYSPTYILQADISAFADRCRHLMPHAFMHLDEVFSTEFKLPRSILSKLRKETPDVATDVRAYEDARQGLEVICEDFAKVEKLRADKEAAEKELADKNAEYQRTKDDLENKKRDLTQQIELLDGKESIGYAQEIKNNGAKVVQVQADIDQAAIDVDNIDAQAGCCGLSKQKKIDKSNLEANIKRLKDERVKLFASFQESKENPISDARKKLDDELAATEAALAKHIKRFPKKIATAQAAVDAATTAYLADSKELEAVRLLNLYNTSTSNQLMYELLRLRGRIDDFAAALRKVKSKSDKVDKLNTEVQAIQDRMKYIFSLLWCPDYSDKTGEQIYAEWCQDADVNIDAKDSKVKRLRDEMREHLFAPEVTAKNIDALLPSKPGKDLKRIKSGDLTSMRPRQADLFPYLGLVQTQVVEGGQPAPVKKMGR